MASFTDHNHLKRSFEEMESESKMIETTAKKVKSSDSPKNFDPRSYQIKVFEVAKKRNTLAVLATGSGKTMIAVMLIKEVASSFKNLNQKKLIIFLAPTVSLVNQQFEVIKTHTDLRVKQYYGTMGVDYWDLNHWKNEVKEHDVMVMTPQVLLDALRKAYLSLNVISLMVLDECHRATGNHPYSKIMKEFYHKAGNKPKIFGMTASPVGKKCVSSDIDCEGQIATLESLLDSKIYSIEDKTELEIFVPSATEVKRYYDPNFFLHEELKKKLECSWSKFDELLVSMQNSLPSQYKDTDETFKALRKKLSSYLGKILHCLDALGFICAYEAAEVCRENASGSVATEECELFKTSFVQLRNFIEEVIQIFKESLPQDYEIFFSQEFDLSKAMEMGYLSPKLFELIQIFQSFDRSKELLCLIFVERIIAAKVIQRFTGKLSHLSHLMGSYLTGGGASADALTPCMQKKTLDSFRCGKVNLLFTTDVAEEGIHVANCSCVIRFDLPKTVRSYVQSRGRARQDGSQYIIMLERGNIDQRNLLFDIIRSEHSMTDSTMKRDQNSCVTKVCDIDELGKYLVESTGASVTADSSVSLIYRFCEKLPGDMWYIPRPTFQFTLCGGLYECELTLPPSVLLERIIGPKANNSHLAKQLVCLEACKRLHESGFLDDHLLPRIEDPLVDDEIKSISNSVAGAGTTKRKELHGTTAVRALSGSWGGETDGISLYAYRIDFSCNQADEFYSGFVLLIETKLDVDVAKVEMELFLVGDKLVKVFISPHEQLHLNAEQVKNAKKFQEFFFNGIFGKLYIGSKSSGKRREFLLEGENKFWDSANMYLLLPLVSSIPFGEAPEVDWRGINSCASAIEFVKKHFSVTQENFPVRNHDEAEYASSDMIKFANTSVPRQDLENMVVLAIHTGKVYSVREVRTEMSAENAFDGGTDAVPSIYSSFREYFKEKYGIVLRYPGQPLLRLKQSHNPHNLLTKPKNEDCIATEKPLASVYMPAELLVPINVSLSVVKSFYLLPSIMHRVQSLLLATQLREEIALGLNNCHMPSALILEALTSSRCMEDFSFERLELLGDSVLKYVVSCTLFLKYPKKHEGQLSARRSYAVCNSTLHKLGTARNLQGYIRDGAFDPRRWVAPGQRSLRPDPCQCGVDSLDVPLENRFITEDTKNKVGKPCDRGHRWMCSKTISDCVEALIGAYYVGGGLTAALMFMKWLAIDAEFEPSLIDQAIFNASLWCYTPEMDVLQMLESKIGYRFVNKGLLLEAITHASQQELGLVYCYQRLEFLGDSVLDLLITQHLFRNHKENDPGELTDLRSASVNNENFAKIAVKYDLQKHLLHRSGLLSEQITEFSKFILELKDDSPLQKVKCPKALGDLVESIAGAILIDTRLDLDEVWRIFEPLLSPIVTPEKLELPPFRELNELCSHRGYFIKETCTREEETVHVELGLQLEDILLKGKGRDKSKKAAKGQAALHLLNDLEERGISHSRHVSRSKLKMEVGDSSIQDMDIDNCKKSTGKDLTIQSSKRKKTNGNPVLSQLTADLECSEDRKALGTPVVVTITTKKGGPRTSLYELCKKLQWPMPTFDIDQEQSRSPVQFGSGSDSRIGFNIFVAIIKLHIPNIDIIEISGDKRADKNSAKDSAALKLLHEVARRGRCIINEI